MNTLVPLSTGAIAVLVPCEKLHGSLTAGACSKRYRLASSRGKGAGMNAMVRSNLAPCRDCPVGRERLQAFRKKDDEGSADGEEREAEVERGRNAQARAQG